MFWQFWQLAPGARLILARGGWDPSGRLDIVVKEDQVPDPNGILFSPDYKKLYVIGTGKGPGDTGPGGKGDISVFDVGADKGSRTRSSSLIAWSTA